MSGDERADFWQLVEQLMLRGWYRSGQHVARNGNERAWGFREGHLTDVRGITELSITAPSETAAMRILLDELCQQRGEHKGSQKPSPALETLDGPSEGEGIV